MDNYKTKVIFRKDNTGEIVAFFPEDYCFGELPCYTHIGQHAYASIEYYRETKKATEEEYHELFNELTNLVGYNLRVVQRMTY